MDVVHITSWWHLKATIHCLLTASNRLSRYKIITSYLILLHINLVVDHFSNDGPGTSQVRCTIVAMKLLLGRLAAVTILLRLIIISDNVLTRLRFTILYNCIWLLYQ